MAKVSPEELLIRARDTDEMHGPLEGAVVLAGSGAPEEGAAAGFVVVSDKSLAEIAPQFRELVRELEGEDARVQFVKALS